MIHVMIERRIAEGMLSTYEQNARNALHRTYTAPGFITGEALVDLSDPHHRYLLCKWRSKQDWQRWCNSPERKELLNTITPILAEPERVTLMDHAPQ